MSIISNEHRHGSPFRADVELARVLSFEPCIMYACLHPSGHECDHEYRRCKDCGALNFAEYAACEECGK